MVKITNIMIKNAMNNMRQYMKAHNINTVACIMASNYLKIYEDIEECIFDYCICQNGQYTQCIIYKNGIFNDSWNNEINL